MEHIYYIEKLQVPQWTQYHKKALLSDDRSSTTSQVIEKCIVPSVVSYSATFFRVVGFDNVTVTHFTNIRILRELTGQQWWHLRIYTATLYMFEGFFFTRKWDVPYMFLCTEKGLIQSKEGRCKESFLQGLCFLEGSQSWANMAKMVLYIFVVSSIEVAVRSRLILD